MIDDWGLTPLTPTERRDLLEVLEDRSERASTLITSQMPVKAWIGEPTLADAICDRLIHGAHIIELLGPSLREARAKTQRGGPGGGDAEPPEAPATNPAGRRKRG